MSRLGSARAEDDPSAARPPVTPAASGTVTRASTMEERAPYAAGAIVGGRYRLVRELGRGGMGEVWRAEHVVLRAEVAIKFPAIRSRDDARIGRSRFRFEAQIAARLGAETPHVVAVRDAGDDGGEPFLVMEYVRGRTLRDVLEERGTLPIEEVAPIVDQVAEALSAAHAFGVAHRDLKPSNILLSAAGGLVKVADFGVAKALRSDLAADVPEDTAGGLVVGSPAYMSPEQISGAPPSASGDLWALAVVAYEALTGRLPFDGRSFADLFLGLARCGFEAPTAHCPALPEGVDAWFARALAKDPARRYSTPRSLARALRAAAVEPPRRALLARIASRLGAFARNAA